MALDNSPKERQQRQLARKRAKRASYDRILIVTEGSKTEPNYFCEIREAHRLHNANVQVRPASASTSTSTSVILRVTATLRVTVILRAVAGSSPPRNWGRVIGVRPQFMRPQFMR